MALFLNDDFQNLVMEEVSRLIQWQSDQNVSLNILIHRRTHDVAEQILLKILERQLKQQVGISPSRQPRKKKLRNSGNDSAQSQLRVNQKQLKKCSIREP